MDKQSNDSKYFELIMAVGNKHPGESRHQTALRYIKEAESRPGHLCGSLGIEVGDE